MNCNYKKNIEKGQKNIANIKKHLIDWKEPFVLSSLPMSHWLSITSICASVSSIYLSLCPSVLSVCTSIFFSVCLSPTIGPSRQSIHHINLPVCQSFHVCCLSIHMSLYLFFFVHLSNRLSVQICPIPAQQDWSKRPISKLNPG